MPEVRFGVLAHPRSEIGKKQPSTPRRRRRSSTSCARRAYSPTRPHRFIQAVRLSEPQYNALRTFAATPARVPCKPIGTNSSPKFRMSRARGSAVEAGLADDHERGRPSRGHGARTKEGLTCSPGSTALRALLHSNSAHGADELGPSANSRARRSAKGDEKEVFGDGGPDRGQRDENGPMTAANLRPACGLDMVCETSISAITARRREQSHDHHPQILRPRPRQPRPGSTPTTPSPFGHYYDPSTFISGPGASSMKMSSPGQGLRPHPHDNMEILTCLSGDCPTRTVWAPSARSSPAKCQRMSAGTGIEIGVQRLQDEPVHLLQI